MHDSSAPARQQNYREPSGGSGLTIAAWYALARIFAWGLLAWQPKSATRTALALLNDPKRSSLNSRIVNQLLDGGMLEEANGTLMVTASGANALLDRPDVMARMRKAGVV